MNKIAIIGAGGWGTALAIALANSREPHAISLWVREKDVLEALCSERTNPVFLPDFSVPSKVQVTGDFATALRDAKIAITAIPAAHVREIYAAMLPFLAPGMIFISATKGIERGTVLRTSEIIEETVAPKFGAKLALKIAVLSGPSFAKEVARGDPTAVVVASRDVKIAEELQKRLSGPALRLYTNADVIGVELGGALKNVIAIAAGLAQGLGLGHNAVAALITRGLAEILRLGVAMGAKTETFAGLAGLGDLVLTCTGDLSRNRRLGIELGRGRNLSEVLASTRMVFEGIGTTDAALDLAKKHVVEMPITEQVHAILTGERIPHEAIRELMDRPLRPEHSL